MFIISFLHWNISSLEVKIFDLFTDVSQELEQYLALNKHLLN